MTPPTVYALDLGTTKVVCLAATLDPSGKVRAEAFASVPCRGVVKGVVSDVPATARAIDEAVSRIERAVGRPVDGLSVTVGGTHLQSVNGQGFIPIVPSTRAVRPDDVLKVVNHSRQVVLPPDREQLMALPKGFNVDGKRGLSRPVGETGGRLEVLTHIVTAQTSVLQVLDRTLTEAGRQVAEMVAEPIASALGVIDPEKAKGDVVVVDIGGSVTGLALFLGGAIGYTCCLPVGGQHVTNDLAHLLKVDVEEADRLKVAHGTATAAMVPETEAVQIVQGGTTEPRPLQRRVLCEIVESRLRELATLVRRHIETGGLAEPGRARLVLTGGASLTPGIEDLFREQTGVDAVVRLGPKVAGPHARALEDPGMSAVVGLARYGLEGDEQELAPVSAPANWKERVRSLKSLFSPGK